MRKFLPIMVLGILVLSGLGAVTIPDDTTYNVKTEEESIAISEPIIKEVDQYVTVSLKEAASSLLNVGKPVLPVVTRVFTLPFGSKISYVDVSFSEMNELVLPREIQPAPEPVPVNAVVAEEPVKDTNVYSSSELYPASRYSCISGAGLDDKEHVIYLAVQCYPVRYSPAQNMIYYSENVDIKITYEEPLYPVMFPDEYDLVVIAPSEFSDELQPLIDHKNRYELKTKLMTTEDIYAGYPGRDEAEQIKYFIKDAIETWGIDYVLLVGGIEKLPIRTTYAGWWGGGDVLSDLYYADIYDQNSSFCSWDGNNNDKFGETYREHHQVYDLDGVDLYADVNIGRLACENIRQLRTVVDKIIRYETDTYGERWFNNIVLCGGDTFPGRNGNEGEEKNKITEQIMSDFVPTKLWTSDNTFSAHAVNKAINKGAGFVDYSGHGFEIGLSTHPPNDDSWVHYDTLHLLGLVNRYKLPIIFFDACLTAKLDFNVSEFIGYLPEGLQAIAKKFNFDGSKLLPCFAWCCVLKPFGGAIATIGATRVAYGSLEMGCGYISLKFYEAYSSSETVSQMLTKAQNDYINNLWKDYFTLEEFILLGDPSLKIGGYPGADRFKARIVDIFSGINGCPDNPVQFQASATDGKTPYVYTWDFNNDGVYDDASGETVEWTWDSPGIYRVSVKVTDAKGNEDTYSSIVGIESKPSMPFGPISGKPGVEYTFIAQMTTDPPQKQIYVYYYFDWGDGTFSDILGPYPLDNPVEAAHTWSNSGSYQIRVKALKINFEDFHFEETGWSDPLSVSMPKNRAINTPFLRFLENFFEKFPNAFPILQLLLQRVLRL